MKIKKTKIIKNLILITFLLSLISFSVEKVHAGCCVGLTTTPNTNGYCAPTTYTNCPTGSNYKPSTCTSISACTVSSGTGSSNPNNDANSECYKECQFDQNPDACMQNCLSNANTSTNGTSGSTTFTNPIGFSNVSDLLNAVLNNLMGLIATISIIFIVIGGIMYMLAGGSESGITRAKKTWTGAVIGLAISLAAPTFLKTIQMLLGGGGTGGSAQNWVAKALTLKQVAINVLSFLLSIFGILAIIALIVGGGIYLTAYGDEKKIDNGKKMITYAVIGIVVGLASIIIVRQVANLLGVNQ